MREILFRGQTRKYGEKVRMGDGQKLPGNWVYGGVLQGIGSHSIIYGGQNADDPSEGFEKWCVHSDTLGQFTGLTDNNGKKIFEGDILYVHDRLLKCTAPFHEFRGVVEHKNGSFVIVGDLMTHYRWIDYDITVLGNIHDNPELLEATT